ncbi:MAG: hypothetical protein JOZ68_08855 [Acidimicrobiia bacterium]|nr:hypothetical protein [Acidimicrobiia bacterium]
MVFVQIILGALLMYLGVDVAQRGWRRQRDAMAEGLLGSAFFGWPYLTLLGCLSVLVGAGVVVAAVR